MSLDCYDDVDMTDHPPPQNTSAAPENQAIFLGGDGPVISYHLLKPTKSALQADGITPQAIVGRSHINITRNNIDLWLDALVVNDLEVDIVAGILFVSSNDISFRPAKHQILIGNSSIVHNDTTPSDPYNHVRRTQAYVLKS